MARIFAQSLIRLYQKILSPDHGWLKVFYPQGYCKFSPTCSEYTYQTIGKYGLIRGSWLGIKRVARCNPWSRGGEDRVK